MMIKFDLKTGNGGKVFRTAIDVVVCGVGIAIGVLSEKFKPFSKLKCSLVKKDTENEVQEKKNNENEQENTQK